MTNEEKIAILRDREDRAYELLRTMEPTDPAFGPCFDIACQCRYRRGDLERIGGGGCDEASMTGEKGDKPEAAKQTPPVSPEAEAKPTEAKAAAPATNETALTKADVLAKLTPISMQYDKLVPAVMSDMGYAKLSQIPAERYGELLSKVEEAVECRQ